MSSDQQPSWHALCTAVRDAPVGIGVCDEDGRMIAVSRSLAQLLRRTPEEIVGRPFLAFVHPADRGASLASYFEAVVAAAAGVSNGRTRVRCLTGDQSPVTVEVAWTVTEADESTSCCGILYLTAATCATTPVAGDRAWEDWSTPSPTDLDPAGAMTATYRRYDTEPPRPH